MKLLNEISILVHEQGEYLNNIEKDLIKAKNYMEKGVKVLEKKKKEAIKSRKVHHYLIIKLNKCLEIVLLCDIFIIFVGINSNTNHT